MIPNNTSQIRTVAFIVSAITAIFFLGGCQTAYYSTMEKLGVHKRDILVDRVEDARNSQKDAKEEFASALEQFQSVVGFEGGALEDKYKKLQKTYDDCEAKAENVSERIGSVEHVAEALFNEWEAEIKLYSNANLQRTSEQKLKATKKNYEKLIAAMKRAEKKITPVLKVFRDQVLFLKHNLNAQAIGSLRTELVHIEADVGTLIKEMEKSITEADTFIKSIDMSGN